MKYQIYGKPATRDEVVKHLKEELEAAKDSTYFQGSIFYNLDYIEHGVSELMKKENRKTFPYFELLLIAE